jgi:hypothetical protein
MNGCVLVAALLAMSALGVARTQPRLAKVAHEVKEKDDVYVLPPPAQLKTVALGYDSAAVDLVWAKLLVDYGTHWQEQVPLRTAPYIDAILYLEPTYGAVYRFADTLLVYHPIHATEADARAARAILERGTRERPWDNEVWLEYGQFTAFLGPGFLTSATDAERDSWRRDGALAILKAVDLGASGAVGLSAATVLQRTGGDTKATIDALKRNLAINYDNEEQRTLILRQLARLNAQASNESEARAMGMIDSIWKTDWPFLTKPELLLLGPAPDVPRCAGTAAVDDPTCAHDWDTLLAEPPVEGP